MKANVEAMKNKIEKRIAEEKKPTLVENRVCFKTVSGGFLRLDEIFGDSIVIEFAENMREAKNNRFEDGDIFLLKEYSEDELVNIITEAIETY
jgi:hypothetical protein|nr:MAG TPA: hypothetical protein [Caudoviricetes sp.]